jgi:phosphatidylserine/phosphatidylglycerophosphate/cardiolipin synthase-like enzyme
MIMYTEPLAGKGPILEIIRESEKYLHINCYLIDDQDIMKAVSERVDKKVNVRIIIDGHPYGGNGQDNLEILRKTGAQVNISPMRFDGAEVFDHAKYMYNEKKYLIGTMNLTDAAFRQNREYFVIGEERKIHSSLDSIFESDWKGDRSGEVDRKDLIVSPDSENRILGLLRDGRKLMIEAEELGDDKDVLESLKAKGKKVKLILPSSISEDDMKNVDMLLKNNVHVKLMPAGTMYIHAKMIFNGKFVFIGSQNFSSTSLLKNREVGLMLKKRNLKRLFVATFKEDWKNASSITKK